MTQTQPTNQDRTKLYRSVALDTPTEVGVGGALITMVQPHAGHERAYNRWYEDDHFYAGAMVGPWVFAGRRWVAPRELMGLRFGQADRGIRIGEGTFISTYFHLAGHVQDARTWARVAMAENLQPGGRGFPHRDHIFTTYAGFAFDVVRDADTPLRSFHALDRNYQGLVVQIIRVETAVRDDRIPQLRAECADLMAGTPIAQVVAFFPVPMTGRGGVGVDGIVAPDETICLLWFLEQDPRECFGRFEERRAAIDGAARGVTVLAAPFVPTVPGSESGVQDSPEPAAARPDHE